MTRTLAVLFVFVFGTTGVPIVNAPIEESPLIELEWLAGRWVIEDQGQFIEETWSPPHSDALVGTLRWSRRGSVWLYELMSIEVEEDNFVFRLRHFNRGLKPWKAEADSAMTYPMVDASENRIVFENPDSDSPRQFVYERAGDKLTVSLVAADGKAQPFVYKLAK